MLRTNVRSLAAPLHGHVQAYPKLKASCSSLGHSVFSSLCEGIALAQEQPTGSQKDRPLLKEGDRRPVSSSICSFVQKIY